MARSKTENITPLELEIMNVLWKEGASNVQAVQGGLPRELAYTTVQTMLNILHRKGRVKRKLKDRAYYYEPTVTRQQVIKQSVGEVLDRLFGGDAEGLVMSLIESKKLTRRELGRIERLIRKWEEEQHDKD